TPAYVHSKTITQADRAQSSRVPVPLPDGPCITVRQTQLVDTDAESSPEEAPSEAEESQPLGSRVPLMSEEFKASELSVLFHRRTARMTVRTQPAMSPSHLARVVEAMDLLDLAFCKRYRSSYETLSPSSSPSLLVWKRYRGTSKLILDTDSEGDNLGIVRFKKKTWSPRVLSRIA
ncbi:hypothetical protein Tco_1171579, partial [Tanacetum coccineum]